MRICICQNRFKYYTWLQILPIMIQKFMMKQWTMKFIMMKIWWLAVAGRVEFCQWGCLWEQLVGKDVFFSSLAGTIAFMILDQKLCFDCFCIFDTPRGGLIARNNIAKAVAVFLLITNVSQRLQYHYCQLCPCSHILWDSLLILLFTSASFRGFSKVCGSELSPRVKLSKMFFRCSMSYSSAISCRLD